MADRKEKNVFSVPQFGGWDQKAGGATDYSMVFSRARVNRKQIKTDFNRSSVGNEEELIARRQEDHVSKKVRKSVPQFGEWAEKAGIATNYTVEFSQARATRKQVKSNFNRSSIGNEDELIIQNHHDSVVRKKKIINYFNCCIN